MTSHAIILAAGEGRRMNSAIPKVLHNFAGMPMLAHVLKAAKLAGCTHNVVVGHNAKHVQSLFSSYDSLNWIYQDKQLGTAHAVKVALANIKYNPKDNFVILYGDVPLISHLTIEKMLSLLSKASIVLLSRETDNPKGYGRIVRDSNNSVQAIIEDKDADDQIAKIREINSGIIALKANNFNNLLYKIDNNNAQKEYYLTDIVELAVAQGLTIETLSNVSQTEIAGVNSLQQLHDLEREYYYLQACKLLQKGVRIMNCRTIELRGNLACGNNVEIDINCIFVGNCSLGNNVKVGANCVIINSRLEDNVTIEPFCHIEGATILSDVIIGPYARVRAGTKLHRNSKIGNFVELKKSTIGANSKINHLSYVGDTEMGENVNVGAGTITCNFDGEHKHKTIIEDGVFVGSNVSLVAPIKIAKGGKIGASSVIRKNTPANKTSLSHSRQIVLDNKSSN